MSGCSSFLHQGCSNSSLIATTCKCIFIALMTVETFGSDFKVRIFIIINVL